MWEVKIWLSHSEKVDDLMILHKIFFLKSWPCHLPTFNGITMALPIALPIMTDKPTMECSDTSIMTRITQELMIAVWALGFVLILWDLVHGRMDDRSLPKQTFLSPHNCTMTSFTKLIHLPHQWWLSPSMKPSHITPQEPHHHQELFERSPVGFLLKSTGNWPRSWVQD